jgi:hypothetical protein
MEWQVASGKWQGLRTYHYLTAYSSQAYVQCAFIFAISVYCSSIALKRHWRTPFSILSTTRSISYSGFKDVSRMKGLYSREPPDT